MRWVTWQKNTSQSLLVTHHPAVAVALARTQPDTTDGNGHARDQGLTLAHFSAQPEPF